MLTWNEERKRYEYTVLEYTRFGVSDLETFETILFRTYENIKVCQFKKDNDNVVYYTYDKAQAMWFVILESMNMGGLITQKAVMKLIEQIFGFNSGNIDDVTKPKIGRNIIIRK